MKRVWMAAAAIAASAALAGAGALAQQVAPAAAVVPKVDVTDASFGCIRKLEPVRGFYVGNLNGDLAATLAAARAETGVTYPVGSIVQLVPTEAMVKREPGFNAATKDWEFFELDVSKEATKIRVRGATDVVNRFGGNCLTCHAQAKPEYDLICEQTHGCAPIPITPVMAKAIQNTDPRCEPMQLPPEQVEALKALAAFMRPPAAQ
jgi:hypothetical protein